MTTTLEIMAAIPDAPQRWPEWWTDTYSTWESDVWSVSGKKWEKKHPLGYWKYIGPDIEDPHNLYAACEVADAVADSLLAGNKADVIWVRMHKCFYAAIEQGTEDHGPTRTAAVVAAIQAALGIDTTDRPEGLKG
jgi:hypothetical protein